MNIADLNNLFQRYNQDITPGIAIMAIQDQQLLLQKCYGLKNLSDRSPILPSSNFNLASVSKSFTAAAIAILEQQSLIDSSLPLKKFFKVSNEYAAITIGDLIYHRSGLPNYAKKHWDNGEEITNERVTDYLKNSELQFAPGEKFEYNDTGYIILANVIEKITAISYPDFLINHIFLPAGMKNTRVYQSQKRTRINERVLGYSEWPFFELYDEYPGDLVYGDGAIYSSLQDLYHWILAIENATIFSEAIKKKIFTRGLTNNQQPIDYGYGWVINKDADFEQYCHEGEWVGFRDYIVNVPQKNLWVAVLSNSCGINPVTIADRILINYSTIQT